MVKVDFVLAIAVFLSLPLVLVFGCWVFYNLNGKKELDLETEYFQQCPFCAYIFFDYRRQTLQACPRCQSLISRGERESMNRIAPRLNNNSGVILLTVVLITMVLALIGLSVMSFSVSQTKSAYQVAESIRARQLAKGAFYQYHQRALEGVGAAPAVQPLDGRNYSPGVASGGTAGSPNETDRITVTVSY